MGKTGQRPLTVTELYGELGRDENINILIYFKNICYLFFSGKNSYQIQVKVTIFSGS
jgi:hypothetical protein